MSVRDNFQDKLDKFGLTLSIIIGALGFILLSLPKTETQREDANFKDEIASLHSNFGLSTKFSPTDEQYQKEYERYLQQTRIILFFNGSLIVVPFQIINYQTLKIIEEATSLIKVEFWYGQMDTDLPDSTQKILQSLIKKFPIEFHNIIFKAPITLVNDQFSPHMSFYNCSMQGTKCLCKDDSANHIFNRSLLFKDCRIEGPISFALSHDVNYDIQFINSYCRSFLTDSISLKQIKRISFSNDFILRPFIVDFPNLGANDDDAVVLYEMLKNKFKEENNLKDFVNADISMQGRMENNYSFGFFSNYGHHRYKIIPIILISLLVIISLNYYINFKRLHYGVYKIDNLLDSWRDDQKMRSLYYTVIYSIIIFFSVNIKFDQVNYRNKPLVIWFFFIYVWGLICLGFLVNFILAR
jgi:hypothetical protein